MDYIHDVRYILHYVVYYFQYRFGGIVMSNPAQATGLLIGVILGLIIAAFLIRYMNRDRKWKTEYDEMQQRARGKAFCYAFYTVMILEAILIFVDLFGIRLPMTAAVTHFTLIVIGIVVLACYCIWHDAYVGLNTNMKRYTIIVVVAGAINLLAGIMAIANGTIWMNGQLQTPFINLLCAFMLIAIGVVMTAKKAADEREEAGDDQ